MLGPAVNRSMREESSRGHHQSGNLNVHIQVLLFLRFRLIPAPGGSSISDFTILSSVTLSIGVWAYTSPRKLSSAAGNPVYGVQLSRQQNLPSVPPVPQKASVGYREQSSQQLRRNPQQLLQSRTGLALVITRFKGETVEHALSVGCRLPQRGLISLIPLQSGNPGLTALDVSPTSAVNTHAPTIKNSTTKPEAIEHPATTIRASLGKPISQAFIAARFIDYPPSALLA